MTMFDLIDEGAQFTERNQNPKKYVWRASGQKILEKIRRAKEALAAAEVIIA